MDYQEAKKFLLSQCPQWPKLLITLGSGLGSLLDKIVVEKEILFSSVPGFRSPSVTGHQGKILLGKLGGNRIACLQGRLHFYEGYSLKEVVFPFQVLACCGVDTFFLTNAAGGYIRRCTPESCFWSEIISICWGVILSWVPISMNGGLDFPI